MARGIEQLSPESLILDGEAVCLQTDGRPDVHALRSQEACQQARLTAFDFLAFDGQDLRRLRLYERRMLLEGPLRNAPDELWFSGDFEDGEVLLRHACAFGLEGIVSKRRDSPYRSGRFDGWRKILCPDDRR